MSAPIATPRFSADAEDDGKFIVWDNSRHEGAAGPYATLPQAVWIAWCLNNDPTSCPSAPDGATPDHWSAGGFHVARRRHVEIDECSGGRCGGMSMLDAEYCQKHSDVAL